MGMEQIKIDPILVVFDPLRDENHECGCYDTMQSIIT